MFDMKEIKCLQLFLNGFTRTTRTYYLRLLFTISAQGRTYDSIELTRAEAITPLSGTFGKAETAVLVLRSDVLSSNVYYRFMLTATNMDGEAKAYIDFKTNGAPSAGISMQNVIYVARWIFE